MKYKYEVALKQHTGWNMKKPHFHDCYVVLLMLCDGGTLLIDREIFSLAWGSLFVIPQSVLHMSNAFNTTDSWYVVRFPSETLALCSTGESDLTSFFDQVRHIRLNTKEVDKVKAQIEKCVTKSEGFGGDIKCGVAFVNLLLTLCELMEGHRDANDKSGRTQSRVQPIIEYVQFHLTDCLKLDTIAQDLYMSKYHLCRIFKESTGMTLGEYIVNCRLHRAKILLRTGYSVQRAGEEAGFCNNAHFIRTFGQHVGISPGKYARRCQ